MKEPSMKSLLVLCGMAIFLAGIMAAVSPARAQIDRAAFQAVLNDPARRAAVIAGAQQSPIWLRNPCPAATFTISPDLGVLLPPQFDGGGKIIMGVWREGVVATGCGRTTQLNIMSIVKPTSERDMRALLPGTTRADPRLQHDALSYAFIAAGAAPAACKDIYIADTDYPAAAPPPPHMPWQEEWTVSACGAPIPVTMQFIPDATGTTIAAHLKK